MLAQHLVPVMLTLRGSTLLKPVEQCVTVIGLLHIGLPSASGRRSPPPNVKIISSAQGLKESSTAIAPRRSTAGNPESGRSSNRPNDSRSPSTSRPSSSRPSVTSAGHGRAASLSPGTDLRYPTSVCARNQERPRTVKPTGASEQASCMRSSISFSPIRANRGGGAMSDSGAMRSDRPDREVEGTCRLIRSLTLPESDLDGLGRRWWMHDASAGRPSLKLDRRRQASPPITPAARRPPMPASAAAEVSTVVTVLASAVGGLLVG